MAQEEKAQPMQRELEYHDAPGGLIRVYSNNVSMASTRFDVRIIFGELVDIDDNKAIVENRVQVTLTWLEAKLLADFVHANVKSFEELNGALKLPSIPDKMVVPQTFSDAT